MHNAQLTAAQTPQYDAAALDLIGELESARDPLEILTVAAQWINDPDIFAWMMLPIAKNHTEISLVSTYPLPKANISALIDDFVYAVGGTASAYGADVASPDVVEIKQKALNETGAGGPMAEQVFNDVGIFTRGKLHAVVRVCSSRAGEEITSSVQRIAKIIGPYVDACLLAQRDKGRRQSDQESAGLDTLAFRTRLEQEINDVRQSPREVSLLRIKLQRVSGPVSASELERAYAVARALVEQSVRGADVVGMISDSDIGILMPNTGPRKALIGAMRIADALSNHPGVTQHLEHFIGVSGWAISGSDVDGLLMETELAATQAQYATFGAVQLYM
ncbi:MAG TPA: hypothetical protein DGT21_01030 [Armatimonadetes bacterium]|jgi:GGDEF domain-containing protein|nr:hypothetical protein [Armatimonadota bacterium]